MSTSRRSTSSRGSAQSPGGARRPKVAGLRNRHQDAGPSTGTVAPEDTSTEDTPTQDTSTEDTSTRLSGDRPGDSGPATSECPAPGRTADSEVSAESEPHASDATSGNGEAAASTVTDSPDADRETTGPADTVTPGGTADDGKHARVPTAAESPVTAPAPGSDEPAGPADSRPAETEPADSQSAGDEPVENRTAEDEPPRGNAGKQRLGDRFARQPAALIAVMLVLTAVFGGLAFWFHSEAYSLRNEGPAANRALVDQAATSQVKGQITEAVETLFSYDYANTAKTEQAAKKLLTGKAVAQYDKLFETVKAQAPKQKLVLTTTVRAAGVTQLQGDRAEVLLFVDQNATRTDTGQSNVGPAQLTVSAEKHGDQWKISGITPR